MIASTRGKPRRMRGLPYGHGYRSGRIGIRVPGLRLRDVFGQAGRVEPVAPRSGKSGLGVLRERPIRSRSPCSDTRASLRGFFGPFRKFDVVSAARRDVRYRTALRRGSHYFPSVDQSLTSTRRSNPKSLGTQRQLSSGEGNMLTRIPAAFIATALLATAIASPALARSAPAGAQRAQQNSCASWHANAPRSDWECAHSSN
jgi:hypothetical protein